MLEPIREYALERSEAAGNTDAVNERHARAYLALAEELAPALNGDGQRAALDRLELEHANLRAAIDWADSRGNEEVALGITIAVWRMWQKRGYLREARIRVAALIACPWFAGAPPELRAKTHEVMGGIIYWHGEVYGARPDYEAALAIWREVGDRREIANACYNLSFVFTMGVIQEELPSDARERADSLLDEALSTYRSLGDVLGEANVYWASGRSTSSRSKTPWRHRHSSRRWRCTASSATGRRRRGRCTCWARLACGWASSTLPAGSSPTACACSCWRVTSPA